jgi:hypothetical protein
LTFISELEIKTHEDFDQLQPCPAEKKVSANGPQDIWIRCCTSFSFRVVVVVVAGVADAQKSNQ